MPSRKTAEPRSSCPIASSLDIVGDRWTLVVLRDVLLAGRRRFSEMGQAEHIATNVLTERLARLEAAGILDRCQDPVDGRKRIYEPTKRGLELIPLLLDLLVWGIDHTEGTAHAALARRAKRDRAQVIKELTAAARMPVH